MTEQEAQDPRVEATRRVAADRVNYEYDLGFVVGFEEGSEWQASRKPEAAPSDTDREALIEVLTSMPEPRNLVSDGVHKVVADDVADAILEAGFSRSQPVQVEVTDEIKVLLHEAAGWDADGVNRHSMSALDTIHRLAAALGGGDHAE